MPKASLRINGGSYYQKDFNMRIICFSVIVILFSCSKKMAMPNSIEVRNGLQIKIHVDDETKLELSIRNSSNRELRISDPECYINSKLEIFGKEGNIQMAMKVKPDISCVENSIVLGAGTEKRFSYPYRLSDLFQLDSGTEYEIHLSYKGGISSSDGIVRVGDASTRLKFITN